MEGLFRPTLNLANSVVGVGILAMPYCIKKCGIILGLLLLAMSAMFTIWSLKMLVSIAFLWSLWKLVIELSIIGVTIGCLISFFIVIGDLAPPIVAKSLGINWSPTYLRMFLMVFLALAVSLPLSLLRNVDSLSGIAACSLLFYSCLLVRVVYMSLSNLVSVDVWSSITLWRLDGLLHCLPIFALALACHPQMFVIYIQMADPSLRKMSTVVNGAVWMVTMGYGLIAFFGYITFSLDGVKGDVLSNFPHDGLSQLFRLGFSLSIVVSFPLLVFPIRSSIYSLLFSKSSSMELHVAEPIPPKKFNLITVCIIVSTLSVAIVVPNVESVLALTGATTGSIISFIFPSLIFLSVVGSHAVFSKRAKFLLVLGFLVMVVGTLTIVNEQMQGEPSPDTKTIKYPQPFVAPPKIPEIIGPPVMEDFKKPPKIPEIIGPPVMEDFKKPPGPLLQGDNDVIKNDVIGGDVIHKEEVHIPAADAADAGGDRVGKVKLDQGVREGDGDRRGGDDGVVKVGGGGVREAHDSIKKDMAELKERLRVVEEENQELKDVLEKKVEGEQVSKDSEQDAAGVPLPPAAVEKLPDMAGEQPKLPDHEIAQALDVMDRLEDAGVEVGQKQFKEQLNLDLKQSLKEESLHMQDRVQDGQGLNGNEGRRVEGEEEGRKREVVEEEKDELRGLDRQVQENIGVAAGHEEEVKREIKEEVKEDNLREETRVEETEKAPVAVLADGKEQDEGRKMRELKALTNKS